jgi:hypothetical protein
VIVPWTKREVIDAVLGVGYEPFDLDAPQTWPYFRMVRAFVTVALGRPEGRASPAVEHELWQRIGRVYTALKEGRDPNAAYEMPLDNEKPLTTGIQLEDATRPALREFDRLLDEMTASYGRNAGNNRQTEPPREETAFHLPAATTDVNLERTVHSGLQMVAARIPDVRRGDQHPYTTDRLGN